MGFMLTMLPFLPLRMVVRGSRSEREGSSHAMASVER
jgi:hypothetical protein